MKASDLMVGDWVVGRSGEPFKIGIIDPDFLYWNEIQPIPLTPEILEKIGFVKYIAGQYVLPKMVGEIFVCITPMEGLPNANGKWLVAIKSGYTDVRIPITYIHELQHALRICGIEKEIIL